MDVLSSTLEKHGFIHLKAFISERECERLILRMRELTEKYCPDNQKAIFRAGEKVQNKDELFLRSAKEITFFFDPNVDEENRDKFSALNKVGHALHMRCPVYRKFSHQRKFYDLARALGQEKPMPVQSMFIFKQSRFGDEVPEHQDASFLYVEPKPVLGLWFALEDATVDNGCLWILDGGHRGRLKNRFMRTTRGFEFCHPQRVDWQRKDFRPIEAKAGDVVVLHGLLPHFSKKNRSEKTRYAYTLHFIDRTSHYPKTNWLDISINYPL